MLSHVMSSTYISKYINCYYLISKLKLWMFLICFALGLDSSEEKKCCVSRAYAVCWVTPNLWENDLTAEKKDHKLILGFYSKLIKLTFSFPSFLRRSVNFNGSTMTSLAINCATLWYSVALILYSVISPRRSFFKGGNQVKVALWFDKFTTEKLSGGPVGTVNKQIQS